MKLFFTVLLFLLVTINTPTITNGCFEVERDALLTFKAGLHDPGNLMSSWHGQDCCNWSGVICDNTTEHVVKLNLRNPYDWYYSDYSDRVSHALIGEINPALLSLWHLTHLDLSSHNFSNLSIPKFIGSFENLVYLNLSFSWFQGAIPYELGNLSQLHYLDLGGCHFTGMIPPQLGNLSDLRYFNLQYSYQLYMSAIDNVSWLSRLSNLRYLDMSSVNLNNALDWSAINKMPLLESLILSDCYVSKIPIDLSLVNLTSLTKLDLSENSFQVALPNWLWNLTNLLYLDLGYSEFRGSIPRALSNLASLNYLSLGGNNFEHVVLEPISKLHNLTSLDLSSLGVGGDIVALIKRLGNMWYNLEAVYLWDNNLSGNISSWMTTQMKNLSIISLSSNSLSGHLTSEIGTLVQLKELDLSYNSLYDVITETHFRNLSNLEMLDLSNNMLTIKMNDKWVPPFQLQSLNLDSGKVGPRFPSWLRGQKRLCDVYLSNTSIAGVIPMWFWNMLSLRSVDLSYSSITGNLPSSFQRSKIQNLYLSHNNISGPLPSLWGQVSFLDLSYNNIFGPIPTKLEFPQARILLISNNRISGSIPYDICGMLGLYVLDLSSNAICGEIPICWNNISNLEYIDLSNNQITGELPASIGSLQYLTTLQLDNNKLHGEIPSALQKCKRLIFLSLGRNNFSGKIPAWIGKELQELVVFQLRSNKFSGYIPTELGKLGKLQILDLAHNSLVGPIPSSVGNFSSMQNSSRYFTSKFVYYEDTLYTDINGQHVYSSMPLEFIKTIDISGNNLNGQIPEEIWLLQAMTSLNLSKNCLRGEISENIGEMRSLESLDFSFNNLSGLIPQALSTLSLLHNLNLSYNNFSGKIPTGRQLDTLSDPSIYAGNPYLCGPPIDKNCSQGQASRGVNSTHSGHEREMIWFFLAVVLGLIVGFWSVWGVLIFQNAWKVAYFRMVDSFFDKMYVYTMLAMRRLGWW